MSRAWGKLNSIELPIWFRKPCYQFYSWAFNCNLNEIEIEDLKEYKNLSEFFRRSLKPHARIIDQNSCLVCPCDGKILNMGRVDGGLLEQVKGVNYSLKGFLGAQNWPKNVVNGSSSSSMLNSGSKQRSETVADMQSLHEQISDDNAQYEKSVLYNAKNRLYHCVIYLAPGDYHRFHSPTDWTIFYRRHFPGELFSVNPSVARWLQGLFNLNERVVYYGQWKHGFFSMSPVGATNVGSIRVFMDHELTTNDKQTQNDSTSVQKGLDKKFYGKNGSNGLTGVQVTRGDMFGEFNLGSTIVLVFEAPENFEFNIKPNEKVYFGQQLGSSSF